jgi:hypothetical protein
VHRATGDRVCKFVGPKVKWLEAYATIGRSDLPNEMWQSRPEGQIEKCAEAAALRKAFPEELGNELTAEEMAGRAIDAGRQPSREAPKARDDGPPRPSTLAAIEHKQSVPAQSVRQAVPELVAGEVMNPQTGEVTWTEPSQDEGIPGFLRRDQAQAETPAHDMAAEKEWLNDLSGALSGCETLEQFSTEQLRLMKPRKGQVSAEAWTAAQRLAEETYHRVKDA